MRLHPLGLSKSMFTTYSEPFMPCLGTILTDTTLSENVHEHEFNGFLSQH